MLLQISEDLQHLHYSMKYSKINKIEGSNCLRILYFLSIKDTQYPDTMGRCKRGMDCLGYWLCKEQSRTVDDIMALTIDLWKRLSQ